MQDSNPVQDFNPDSSNQAGDCLVYNPIQLRAGWQSNVQRQLYGERTETQPLYVLLANFDEAYGRRYNPLAC